MIITYYRYVLDKITMVNTNKRLDKSIGKYLKKGIKVLILTPFSNLILFLLI